MFENLFNKIASIIITGALALASLFGYTPSQEFGAVNPVAGTVYYLSGSGIGASATSITLTSLTVPQSGYELVDSDFSTTFYLTIEPGNRTRQEIASCTTVVQNADNTATLSGCSRGLLPFSPYTASSTYQFSHSGGTSVIFSNPPQLYEELPARGDAESITGLWTFSSSSIPRLDSYLVATNDAQFISKKYADDLVASGVADGNYTTFGGYVLATTSQIIAGTATSTATRYLVLPSELSNTTSSAKNIIPITKDNGKLSQGFLDLTEGFTFSGGVTSTATTTITGNVVGLKGFGGDGSDGALSLTSGTTTLALSTSSIYLIKNYTSISITGTGTLAFANATTSGNIIVLKSQGDVTLTCSVTCINASGLGANGGAGGIDAGNGSKGTSGNAFFASSTPGNGGLNSSGVITASTTNIIYYQLNALGKMIKYSVGAGGGGGGGGGLQDGGNGGRGGGVIIIEVGGTLNMTASNGISVAGENGLVGQNGSSGGNPAGGGGGGGAGGPATVLYNFVSATSTINVNGGTGGNGGAKTPDGATNGGAGGAGGSNLCTGGMGGGQNVAGGIGSCVNGGAGGAAGGTDNSAGGGGGGGGAGSYVFLYNTEF